MTPSNDMTTSALRSELIEVRSELAKLQGEFAAIDASLVRVQQQIDRLDGRFAATLDIALSRLNDKLDSVVGIKSKIEDITGRISLVEVEVKQKQGWQDRLAWLYAGFVTAVVGTFATLKALGKI